MILRKSLLAVVLAGLVSIAPAFAQEVYKSEASVQFLGTFVSSTWLNSVQQTATDSGGVLANYRFFFNNYNGVEVNYGWAAGTQKYSYLGGVTGVRADSNEATAAYVVRYPGHRVVPFGLVGGGALMFDPLNAAPATMQARPALDWGGGIDVGFGQRFFLRAQYRGFFYSSPDFNTAYLNMDKRTTVLTEPSIGFGIRF